jgi:hypothetical protein
MRKTTGFEGKRRTLQQRNNRKEEKTKSKGLPRDGKMLQLNIIAEPNEGNGSKLKQRRKEEKNMWKRQNYPQGFKAKFNEVKGNFGKTTRKGADQ